MSIPPHEFLHPGHDLYRGDGEYARHARNLHRTLASLHRLVDELVPLRLELRVVIGRALGRQTRLDPDLADAVRLALRMQHEILVELHELAAMLEDPALRWFMKTE
tara:strand:+ start:149 stop:466 length:318 start_codon:yes stop_codon:yes gene_type:complete